VIIIFLIFRQVFHSLIIPQIIKLENIYNNIITAKAL
jgi:hypothetical protein